MLGILHLPVPVHISTPYMSRVVGAAAAFGVGHRLHQVLEKRLLFPRDGLCLSKCCHTCYLILFAFVNFIVHSPKQIIVLYIVPR